MPFSRSRAGDLSAGEGSIVYFGSTATGAARLQDGKFHTVFFGNGQRSGRTGAECRIHTDAVLRNDLSVYDLRRGAWNRQAAQYLRADGDDLMPLHKGRCFFAVIVAAAVFAVFAQQAGAYQNLHRRVLSLPPGFPAE